MRGKPGTRAKRTFIVIPEDLLVHLDRWAGEQPVATNRSEAIRSVLRAGLLALDREQPVEQRSP